MICRTCGIIGKAIEFTEEGEWLTHLQRTHGIVKTMPAFPLTHVRAKNCPPSGEHPTLCGLFTYGLSIKFEFYHAGMRPTYDNSRVDTLIEHQIGAILAFLPEKICGECAVIYADAHS